MAQMNIPNWGEVPEEMRRLFEDKFNSNPSVIKLHQRIDQLQRNHDYVRLLDVYRRLDEIRLHAQKTLVDNKDRQVERVTLLDMKLSREDIEYINTLTIAMYMLCDIADFISVEIDERIKRADKTAHIDMFDEVIKVGRQAQGNLKYLWNKTHMYDTDYFNDRCDDMRNMLVNKARKVMNEYNSRKKQ